MELILHPKTQKKLAVLERDLPHAILLAGEKGVGLTAIARHIAGSYLASFIEPQNSKEEIDHETGTISVATIRRLYEQTRSKSLTNQVVVLKNAHRMSLGAQAAFLKLLEEPNEHTHFILTSHSPGALLPTIKSRVQTLYIDPVMPSQTNAFLDTLGISDPQTRRQLEYLASGLPAELIRLSEDEAYFKLRAEIMTDTRSFLTNSAYEKLLVIQKYHQDRSKTLQLIDSALMVTKRSISAKPQPVLVNQLDTLLSIRDKIETNCSIRLQLMAFVLQ